MKFSEEITSVDGLRAIIEEPNPLVQKKIINALDDVGMGFVREAPFVLVATSNTEGQPDVSPRGDAPGLAWIKDERTLYLPDRPGNNLAMSLQNLLENPRIGLMFMIPGVDECYRVQGRARLLKDPELLEKLAARGRPALLAIEVSIETCFLHCGKSMKRSRLWKYDSRRKFDFRFGKTIAREAGGGKEMEDMVNQIVAEDYKEGL